jgi:hypothetical protein
LWSKQIKKILYLITKHFSFLIILISSVSIFIISIGLKEYLSPTDYSKFAMILTFITLSYSYGLIGLDKVMLRLSSFKDKIIYINKDLIKYLLPISIFTIPILTISLNHYIELGYLYSFYLVAFPTIFIFVYNLYRLKSEFNFSQIILNLWKLLLLIYLFFYLITSNSKNLSIENLLIPIIVIFIALFIISIYKISRENYNFYEKNEDLNKYLFQYFISLTILSIMGFGDRFLVEYFIDLEQVGIFFFYLTITTYPFSLFQTYIGFKKVPEFKNNFSREILKKEIKNSIIISIIPFITVIIIIFILNTIPYFINLKIDNFLLIFILTLLGVAKLISGVLSAATNVVSLPEDINKINILSILSFSLFLILFLIENVNLVDIAIMFLIVWSLRNYFYFKYIYKRLDLI